MKKPITESMPSAARTLYRSIWLLTGLTVAFTGCQDPAGEPAAPEEVSSFKLIQERILTPSCAVSGCHASEQDGSFNQHKLVLSAGQSLRNLLNVTPTNLSARTDGIVRVKPFNSLQSLLFHKVNPDPAHHGGKSYGTLMPLGRDPLSVGQIEFIRRWIEAGAPEKGNVADTTLLNDRTPSVITEFEPLAPPASGEGFQMTTGVFDVAPNFERELFIRKNVGNSSDVYVKRMQVRMRTNSHHFVAYSFANEAAAPQRGLIRDLRNPDGTYNFLTLLSMQNHVFFAGSQSPSFDYTFPEGAALEVPANMTLDLNSHYVNKTANSLKGEAYFNLFTVPKSSVKHIVRTLNWANTNLNLPARTRTTVSRTFTAAKPMKILALTSHMHKLGEKFIIRIKGGTRDGQIVYTSTDWEHPDMVNFPTPISLRAGEGLTSEITYNNTTAKTVSFGLSSEDEMGIIFGYYYED